MDSRATTDSAAYLPPYLRPFNYTALSPYSAVGYGGPANGGYPLPYPATSTTVQPSYFSRPLPSVSSIPTPSPTASPEDSDDELPSSPPAKKARSQPQQLPHLFRPINFDSAAQSRQLPPTPDSDARSDTSSEAAAKQIHSASCSPAPQHLLVTIPRLTSSELSKDGLTLTLLDSELWKSFQAVGNEMIVTKPGRRIFPALLVSLKGLDPTASYSISLRILSADQYRYKFLSMHWVPVGESEVLQNEERQVYNHPSSPSSGQFWMKKPISFKSIKITHNGSSRNGNILLHTMHKYTMEVVVRSESASGGETETVIQIPETTFIAVTAYQNTKLTQLKIDNNPFAKGFRDRESAGCYVPGMPLSTFSSPYGPGSSLWQQMPSLPPLPLTTSLPPPLIPSSNLSQLSEAPGPCKPSPPEGPSAYHLPSSSYPNPSYPHAYPHSSSLPSWSAPPHTLPKTATFGRHSPSTDFEHPQFSHYPVLD